MTPKGSFKSGRASTGALQRACLTPSNAVSQSAFHSKVFDFFKQCLQCSHKHGPAHGEFPEVIGKAPELLQRVFVLGHRPVLHNGNLVVVLKLRIDAKVLFAGARLSWWLSRDVAESQLLGRGVRCGNSTQNHALSGCARLVRLVSRCLLSATTRDDFAES